MLTNKECCHKLPLILLKIVKVEGLKHSQKLWLRPNGGCFHNNRIKLFSGNTFFGNLVRTIFPLIFVAFSSLAALFALFLA